MSRRVIRMEMNRVEGDLEIRLEVEGNTITDAWCVGTMFRGYEQILVGRSPLDALVITPRICGICSTSQLYAATLALEDALGCDVAPNGVRIRNLCLMSENVMSDARHTFLMFAPDYCNPAYRDQPLFEQVRAAFEPPFKGQVAQETVQLTKKMLGVVIAFGGQWPHSTYMMPGGVTCPLSRSKLVQSLAIVDEYTRWYERRVLGCTCDDWLALDSAAAFDAWLASPAARDSAAGLLVNAGRALGLDRLGRGSDHLLSAGGYPDPDAPQGGAAGRRYLSPGGYFDGGSRRLEGFDHTQISEHVRYSWYRDYGGGRHPWDGETTPDYRTGEDPYSFAKAPRYRDQVVQVGPLADLIAARDPLISSLFERDGASSLLRQLTRVHRPVLTLQRMRACIEQLIAHLGEPTFAEAEPRSDADGYGFINAARGSLGHWIRIAGGKIANYQIITPTSWNGSPRDSAGRRGHWEDSFIGVEVKDLDNPVEVGHIVRSHDACLVCTVHFARTGQSRSFQV